MALADLRDAAQSGGPSKDGIPAIDDPTFVGPGAADFLGPGDPVFGVARDGVAKAYPSRSSSPTRSSTTNSLEPRSASPTVRSRGRSRGSNAARPPSASRDD